MKVLFFNYEYPPLGGGAGNASFFILKEYAKIPGLEVDFITSSIDGDLHIEKIGDSISIHKLPIGKNKKNLHYQSQRDLLIYAWKAYFYSKKLAKEKKYDLTHSFFTVPCGFISLLLRRKYKIPYVISLRGADVPGFSERFSIIYFALKPIIKYIWKKSSAVVSCSAGLKSLAAKTSKNQEVGIIYNGINTAEFCPKIEARPSDKLIITTGATRLTGRKGIKYLIEAMGKISDKYPQVVAKIMGEGDDRENLEVLAKKLKIENKIEFIGRIPREELYKYYQEASIFVMPSTNEGMSNAMLEALGCGLPIISTPTGGAEELIKDGVNGYVVRFRDSADIAEKIEKLINNPELAKNMGAESRRIAEGMSWGSVAEKYVQLYKNVKGERVRG